MVKRIVRFSCMLLAVVLMAVCVSQMHAQGDGSYDDQGASSPQIDTQYHAFRNNLLSLFNQENYKELDSLANTAESQKLRFKGDWWQIREYYAILCRPELFSATDEEWLAHFTQLEEWSKQIPKSVVPRILLAEGYQSFAFKARGTGYGNTVTPDGWKQFRERIQKSREILEGIESGGRSHAEWYFAMQGVALTQNWTVQQEDDLASAALKVEPGYFYIARSEANFLLPQWHGKSGDIERFAKERADSVGGDEGDILYFMVANKVDCCGRLHAPGMDWSRIQQGYAAVNRNYGAIMRQTNAMAFFALRFGDREAAEKYFGLIGDNWDQRIWATKARFDASRLGKELGGVKPVLAYDPVKGDTEVDK